MLHKTATVSLWLPRTTAADAGACLSAQQEQAESGRGRGRMLLVDDEATVRQTLTLLLRRAGFEPTAVGSGEAALDALQGGDLFDLLITDQTMPGITGCELIEAVARLRLSLPTMLITGYDKVSGLDQVQGRTVVLHKPFQRRAFLDQVQALLGATPDAGPRIDDASAPAPNVIQLRATPAA